MFDVWSVILAVPSSNMSPSMTWRLILTMLNPVRISRVRSSTWSAIWLTLAGACNAATRSTVSSITSICVSLSNCQPSSKKSQGLDDAANRSSPNIVSCVPNDTIPLRTPSIYPDSSSVGHGTVVAVGIGAMVAVGWSVILGIAVGTGTVVGISPTDAISSSDDGTKTPMSTKASTSTRKTASPPRKNALRVDILYRRARHRHIAVDGGHGCLVMQHPIPIQPRHHQRLAPPFTYRLP